MFELKRSRRMFCRKLSMVFAVLFTALLSAHAVADIKLGVFPRRPADVTYKAFKPLADYLSEKLGEKVELIVPKTFKDFWIGVKNNEFDLVHYNQYHYIKSHKELGYRVIVANEEFGNKQLSGAISVRKDSGINNVADLRGHVILFGGGRKAMGSFIAPTAILKKAGLREGKDYAANYAANPPSAVVGVYNKGASAAGSGNVVLRLTANTKQINAKDMKIIAESEPYTQLPWAVKASMSETKAKQIQAIMTSLKNSAQGKAILKAAMVTDFFAVTDADYANVREITKYAIGEDY
jgi:phosphonate transport system substrate-binding protein